VVGEAKTIKATKDNIGTEIVIYGVTPEE